MTWTVSEVLDPLLLHLRLEKWHAFYATVAGTAIWVLLRWFRTSCRQLCTTQLQGPPSESFLYGVEKRILDAEDSEAVYEAWAQEYGPAYTVPSTLRETKVVLCDPKAIAHFYSKETWTYTHIPFSIHFLTNNFGKGLLCTHEEDHKRQRKLLTPAFSVSAIRHLTPIFYDSVYKAKDAWDVLLESSSGESALIDVQNWTNHISLDIIGLAGFSHNCGALEGKHADVTDVFDTFCASPSVSTLHKRFIPLAQAFPSLLQVPTSQKKLLNQLSVAMEEICDVLLARTQKELDLGVIRGKEETSIIGLLIKGANADSEFHLTKDEVMAQWAIIELSRNPDVQTKLRNELLEHGLDPTYDEFSSDLPYLDAVVHETLRLHPPVGEVTRVAIEDDVIPLSEPVRTKSGELVDSLTITKDTMITISMESMNRSSVLWGEDAKVFQPTRWLKGAHGQDGIPAKAKEIQGHRHLLTFVDGPRTCLGKNFAVTEFKVVLTVLVKNFVFELRDGVDSKIEIGGVLLPRPKLAGEEGCKVPLRVRPYVA